MFRIKRADGFPFETMVYGVKEDSNENSEYMLKFLIYYKEKWDWVYANDFVPISESIKIPKLINIS